MPEKRPATQAEIDKGWVVLQQSRAFIAKNHKYFRPTVLGLMPRHAEGTETLRVSRDLVLRIDFQWFGTETAEIGAGCILNTTMHVLRHTCARIDGLHIPEEELDRARYAFEIPINDDLKKYKINLPEWAVYSSTHQLPEGLSGEKYYELLVQKNIVPPAKKRVTAGGGGSITGGVFLDEQKDTKPGRTPQETQYFRKVGRDAFRQHFTNMKAGNLPGTWKEILDFQAPEAPVIPWQHVVGAAIGNAFGQIRHGYSDYSLRRPSKRSYAMGLLRPGMITHEPNVCFIEDSSGSMLHEMLRSNRIEAINFLQQFGIQDMWFLNSDTDVHGEPQRVRAEDLKHLPVLGRGGTSFTPAIEAAMRLRPPPDLIIYSTDGFSDVVPAHQPRNTEFIWLFAPGPYSRSPCDWGIQILTSNDRDDRKKFELLSSELKGKHVKLPY